MTTTAQPTTQLSNIAQPRLPYPAPVQEKFGIDADAWKALVEAVFPNAQSAGSVFLALSYCKARGLDVFKRNVHIVPIWDKDKRRYVDTIWPGIGELRTTAFRTRQYAGRDATQFGPDLTSTWGQGREQIIVTHPEWAQVTVHRMIDGQRVPFAGPPVYWLETFAATKEGFPNSMWQKRPRGQIDKCAEGAALRAAFPEELGDMPTSDEGPVLYEHGGTPLEGGRGKDVSETPGIEGCKERMRKAIESAPVETPAASDTQAQGDGAVTDAEGPAAERPDLLGELEKFEPSQPAEPQPQPKQKPLWECARRHTFEAPTPKDGTLLGVCPTCGIAQIRRLY
ncbi:MAG: phage recombination protein Bet [Phycisphaerae bacterium]|nr:phage recombination protein Bet [Phycisphaerae bacterium]